MKVVVIGAGGIIGQHLHVSVPVGVDATFTRRTESHLYRGFDAFRVNEPDDLLNELMPDVVVNLAGESRPDVVEQSPSVRYWEVNCDLVDALVTWCDTHNKHLIHASSQAALDPVNAYGEQKRKADDYLAFGGYSNYTIVRPTFVLGIRPFPGIGRENPAERMLAGQEHQSVDDRYFAVAFAWDVAEMIWKLCQAPPTRSIHYVGGPTRVSRYELAVLLASNQDVVPVKHEDLPGLAPRPLDTTGPYEVGSYHTVSLANGLIRLRQEWESRQADDVHYKSKEIAAFLHLPHETCLQKLESGFGTLHGEVAEDFRRANPTTDEELTAWYRETEAYIWELTAYHVHPGFNYVGMCKGIVDRLKADGKKTVLCLGDGTGDLSLAVAQAGMSPCYNDLYWSRIANFAESSFQMRGHVIQLLETGTFTPISYPGDRLDFDIPLGAFDAIVSADFLEHVPNVEEWVRAIYGNLVPGGLFFAQNAFNCGSGPQGSIPMHLTVNDHFEKDWDPLLNSIGFVQESSNWYRKPL
jgi:dTDP-4-dehydrorhamnose reductase/SAM-dependent methyltransferase